MQLIMVLGSSSRTGCRWRGKFIRSS